MLLPCFILAALPICQPRLMPYLIEGPHEVSGVNLKNDNLRTVIFHNHR